MSCFVHIALSYLQLSSQCPLSLFKAKMATFDEINSPKVSNSKILVGFTTDAWNVGMRKYKEFLAVHKMTWKVANHDVQCVEVRRFLISLNHMNATFHPSFQINDFSLRIFSSPCGK
jgi:hypothetical protein